MTKSREASCDRCLIFNYVVCLVEESFTLETSCKFSFWLIDKDILKSFFEFLITFSNQLIKSCCISPKLRQSKTLIDETFSGSSSWLLNKAIPALIEWLLLIIKNLPPSNKCPMIWGREKSMLGLIKFLADHYSHRSQLRLRFVYSYLEISFN